MLLVADEVGRELHRGQAGAAPLAGRLALFLEGPLDHQLHRLLLAHAAAVDRLVEDGVGDGAQVPLELDQAHERVAADEAGVGHELLGVDRPALDEGAGGEQRAQGGGVAVGEGDLEEVPRHGLVDGEVAQREDVVLAQERARLLLGPLLGQRCDREEGLLAAVEGAGRVAVRHRDAALELRHDHDLDRVRRHCDEVVLLDERGRVGQVARRGLDDPVAIGELAAGDLEGGAGDGLAVRLVGLGGELGVGVLLEVDRLGHVVHLQPDAGELGEGAVPDVGARERRVEREGELAVEHLLADAEVAGRGGQQGLLQPLLLRLDGGARGGHGLLEAVAQRRVELGQRRSDHLVEEGEHAAVLLHRDLGVDPGHPARDQGGADLFEEAGELLEPGGDGGQAGWQRRVLPRHQAEDGAAGGAGVEKRVALPLAQRLELPERRLQVVLEQRRVDLVGTRELVAVDLGEGVEQLARELRLRGAGAGRDLVEAGVEAVVALERRADRREDQPLIEVARREALEGAVGARGGAGGRGAAGDGDEDGEVSHGSSDLPSVLGGVSKLPVSLPGAVWPRWKPGRESLA